MKTKKAAPTRAKTQDDPVDLDLIDHIAIPILADEIDSTVNFYLKNFGCQVIYRDDSWAFLRFGNIKLAFVAPDEHPAHLAFIKDKAEDYGTLKTHRDGTRSVYIKDPSHNTIEIMAEGEGDTAFAKDEA
jgi:extradiol dioxygenase family protein